MEEMNLKQHIDETMEDIRVNDNLKKVIMKDVQKEQKPAKKFNKKKLIVIAAAAALIAAFPLTVGAKAIGRAVSDWVYASVNGSVADAVYPVYDSYTEQGIKVEVESAVNDSHRALIFLNVQDVEGKGRIADVDFLDSYYLSIGGDGVGTMVLDSYDPETQTARFYADSLLHEDISGKNVNFRLTEIMYGKTQIEMYDTGVKLSEIMQKNAKTGGSDIQEIDGYNSVDLSDDVSHKKPQKSDILTPDIMNVSLGEGIDFVHITNVGYVNGKLHVQVRWEPSYDNHGWFNLCPKDITDYSREDLGEYLVTTIGINEIGFTTKKDNAQSVDGLHAKHTEIIFDVAPGQLDNYNLIAEFDKDGEVIKGNWNINFKMQGIDTLKIDKAENADSVEISPLGVYVKGCTDKHEPQVVVTFKDGSHYEVDRYEMAYDTGLFSRKTDYYMGISGTNTRDDIGDIASVALDGKEIYVNSEFGMRNSE